MKYSPFRHIGSVFSKRDPIHLTFFVTKKCNAKCPFCFYLSRNDNGTQVPELSLEEIERVSQSLGDLLWLAFSGGEIFLREDLADITKIFYKNNRPSIILLSTNGLLPERIREQTEDILKRCKNSTVVVKLSLDGPEAVHDSLRGVRGAYQNVIRTYELLEGILERYDNFEIGINTVFCSLTQDHMNETITLVNGLEHIRTHTVSLVRGDIREPEMKEVDMEKYHRTIQRMQGQLTSCPGNRYRFRGAKLKTAQDILQRRLIYETVMQRKRLISCYAGMLNLVMTETGDVYPCESFDMSMGNIRESDYDVQRLLRHEGARKVKESIRRGDCYCTHECYMMTNILFNPSLYPAVIKEFARI
jgi:radical SAM protein with 4Fe4S-binding SPASM domain